MRARLVGLVAVLLTLCAIPSGAAPSGARPELLVQNGHVFSITSIAFSADERLVATGSSDGAVKIWDPSSGRLLMSLRPKISYEGGDTSVLGLAFSPDGKTLYTTTHGAGVVERWEVASGKRLGEMAVEGTKYNVPIAIARDGRTLYAGGATLDIYDLGSGKKVGSLPESDIYLESMEMSADGSTIVAGGSSGQVRAWDLATRTLKGKTQSALSNSTHVSVNANGRVVAVGSSGKAEVWTVGTAAPRALDLPEGGTYAHVAMSPDGSRVVVGGSAGNNVVDTASGKVLAPVPSDHPISQLAFKPDGKSVAAGDDLGLVQLYTLDPVRPSIALRGHAQARSGVAFTQRGQRMVTTGLDRTAKVWDCVAGRPTTVIQLPWDGAMSHRNTVMAASLDGRIIATGGWDGAIEAWDADTGKRLWSSNIGGRRFRQHVTSMAFSRDGRLLAVGNICGNIGVWEASTGNLRLTSEGGPDISILSLAFSPDGRTLAVGRGDGIVDQWDVSHFKFAHIAERETRASNLRYRAVWAVSFSPDGRRLAAATGFGNVYLWDAESDKAPEVLGFDGPLTATSVVKGSSTKVTFQARPPVSPLVSAAFSPDASTLATGSVDGTLTVYDLRTHAVRATNHENQLGLSDLAFTPNGRVIATAGDDGTIGLWDASTARRVATAVELDRGRDWVVTTPEGLFDGSAGGQRLMEWKIGDKLFALDQFFNEFYTPGLLGRILQVGKTDAAASAQALMPQRSITTFPAPPRVEIASPASGDKVSADSVTVQVKMTDQGGGISSPRLYLNGHRLPDATLERSGNAFTAKVKMTAGTNRLRATAYNKEGTVESRGDEVRVTCDTAATSRPTLHVVAVGIDRYQAGLGLAFARADAEAISGFFKPGLFGQVQVHLLTDDKASKQAILDALREVGRQSAPQDAVLLYLAGHGTLVGDIFYFLPWDAKVGAEDEIRKTGLSSVELGEALTNISATKQLLVLDACHSGASATPMSKMLANRDSIAEIRAVQRLSRSSGSFLIAASKAEQYAKEIPELGHGVLTYAILTALGEKSKPAASANGEGQVTVNALLRYLDDEVPKLTEKYQRGDRQEIVQASTGQDFPLVIVITR